MTTMLDKLNQVLCQYGIEPLTWDDIYNIAPEPPMNVEEAQESFNRLWQTIREKEYGSQV